MKKAIYIAILLAFSSPLFAQFECKDFSEDFNTEGCTTSIPKNDASTFVLYPNPTGDELNVKTDSDVVELQIFDLQGRLLITKRGKKVDVSNLAQGSYIAIINQKFRFKFVKI